MKTTSCDILIIGSGLAGLYAAFRVPKETHAVIISKASDPFANSWHAQGGIAAAIGRDDSADSHIEDTLRAGCGISDPDAAMILVEEGKRLMQDLISKGLKIDTNYGEPSLGLEGGHSTRRIVHLDGDLSGRRTMEFLHNNIKRKDNITVIPESEVMALTKYGNRCTGAHIYHHDSDTLSFIHAGSTLIATGGLSALYPRSTNPEYSIGDGISLAWEAGAALQDMEFIQFHPTAFCVPGERAFLISEAVRGEGAKLVTNKGKPFLKKANELATRDVVARGIYTELQNTEEKSVNLDLRHLDEKYIKLRFASIYNYLSEKGINMTKQLIPVAPAAHYMIGGIKTDISGKTTLPGLYAAGEVASTGVMGANRLASNSLLECVVFADRAIESICFAEQEVSQYQPAEFTLTYDLTEREAYRKLRKKLGKILNKRAGIIRSEKGLKKGIKKLHMLEKDISRYNTYYSIKSRQAINNAGFILDSALAREESRGAHYRSDFPLSSTDFHAHSELRKGENVRFSRI